VFYEQCYTTTERKLEQQVAAALLPEKEFLWKGVKEVKERTQ
jgi:hypothetical protein